jgi:4-oxalomesaconate hydratase
MTESSVLVFSAHCADFCSRSGGTLALYAQRGAAVHVVDLTFGERGESEDYWRQGGGTSEAEAKKMRMAEAEEAAGILGVTIEFLDYGDYPLIIDRERLESMARLIRERRPDIILTHWKSDPFNPDHAVATDAVLRAASIAAVPGFEHQTVKIAYPYVFAFEPTVPRNEVTGFCPDHYIDIEEVFEIKLAALRALKSQTKLPRFYTVWAEYRGFQASQLTERTVRYAEAFQRITATVDTRLPSPRAREGSVSR